MAAYRWLIIAAARLSRLRTQFLAGCSVMLNSQSNLHRHVAQVCKPASDCLAGAVACCAELSPISKSARHGLFQLMHRGGGDPSNGQAGGLPYVFRTSRGVFAACALLVAARDAEAQEALRSALSLDRIAQARQNTVATDLDATAAPHIGPVQAALGFYVSEQYNDNINYAQTGALADEISEVGCNSMFTWPATPQSSLYLNAGGSYVKYLNHSE